jgi:hypothetical protein
MRHCSFCGDDSHTIVTCDSEALPDFEFICVRKVLTIETTAAFKEWLSRDYSHDIFLLRAFAMRKYRMDAERQIPRITSRSSFAECADVITNYIFTTYNGEVGLDQTTEPIDETTYPGDFVDREFADLLNAPIQPLTLEDLAMTPNADLRGMTDLRDLADPATIFQENPIVLYDLRLLDSILGQIGAIMQRDPSILGTAILVDLRMRITEILNGADIREQAEPPTIINSRVETNGDEQLNDNCSCSICWDERELVNFVRLDCQHEFCKDCIIATTTHNNGRVPCCALCRGEVRTLISRTDEIQAEILQAIR